MNLTPDQARAQLAGLEKQKDVVDKSIKMLAESGATLHDAEIVDRDIWPISTALQNIIAVQLLQLELQQEVAGANIAALKGALNSSGIVLPSMLPPKGVA